MKRSSHLRVEHKQDNDEILARCKQLKRLLRQTGAESLMQVVPNWPDEGDGAAVMVLAIQLPLPFEHFAQNISNIIVALHEHGYWPHLREGLEHAMDGWAPDSNTGPTIPLDDDVPF